MGHMVLMRLILEAQQLIVVERLKWASDAGASAFRGEILIARPTVGSLAPQEATHVVRRLVREFLADVFFHSQRQRCSPTLNGECDFSLLPKRGGKFLNISRGARRVVVQGRGDGESSGHSERTQMVVTTNNKHILAQTTAERGETLKRRLIGHPCRGMRRKAERNPRSPDTRKRSFDGVKRRIWPYCKHAHRRYTPAR